MKEYDFITISSDSAMNIVSAITQGDPGVNVVVTDADELGRTRPTRGCVPSKILPCGTAANYPES
jgi:pyruvate/2-oxoglutarate dehydrogenase complex dihydrolipoamide dehydrogenase (E3) component